MSRRDKHPVPLLKNPPRLVTGCARFPRWKWMSLWLAVGVSRAFLKSDLRDLWLPLLSLRLHCPHECVRLSDTALLKACVLLSFCLWMSRTETHWCLETVKVSKHLLLIQLFIYTFKKYKQLFKLSELSVVKVKCVFFLFAPVVGLYSMFSSVWLTFSFILITFCFLPGYTWASLLTFRDFLCFYSIKV